MNALLLHIPAPHQGFLNLFEQVRGRIDILGVIERDVTDQFPELAREIHAIDPSLVKSMLSSLNLFPRIELVSKKRLGFIRPDLLMLDQSPLADYLVTNYFYNHPKLERCDVFLHWDAKNVQSVKQVEYHCQISEERFHQECMRLAHQESRGSSDWFRQVGAVLAREGKVILAGYNTRLPSPHSPYLVGDPRNYVELGCSTDLRSVLHAEQAVFVQALRRGIALEGCELYVTTFPCPDCANLIAHSGIKRIFFSSGYAKLDSQEELKRLGVEIVWVKE